VHRKVARLVRDRLPFSRSHLGRFRPFHPPGPRFIHGYRRFRHRQRGNSCA